MKGLVLKDLYSVRLQIFLSVLTMILPNIAFTFLIGEEGVGLGEAETVCMVFFFGLLNYINICLFSSFMLNTLDSDVNCGWGAVSCGHFLYRGIRWSWLNLSQQVWFSQYSLEYR